jgi:hypothetical protein
MASEQLLAAYVGSGLMWRCQTEADEVSFLSMLVIRGSDNKPLTLLEVSIHVI